MKALTTQDVVAANFRNALLDAVPNFDFFAPDYEQKDAIVLEVCYKKTDEMSEEELQAYAECISLGYEIQYNVETEDFDVIGL